MALIIDVMEMGMALLIISDNAFHDINTCQRR